MEYEEPIPTSGDEIVQGFELSVVSLLREILNSVSCDEIAQVLAPLPNLKAEKVKSKFNDCVEEDFTNQLHGLLGEEYIRKKINLLADLEASTPNTTFTWRPNEGTSPDTLYRPYRVKFLKDDIKMLEDRINIEKVKVESNKSILSTLLEAAQKNYSTCEHNNQEIEDICKFCEIKNISCDEGIEQLLNKKV